MKSGHFKSFKFEVGFYIENSLSKRQVENAFEKLIKIERLDGIKKVSTKNGKTTAKITSSDNTLVLKITPHELTIGYTNIALKKVTGDIFEQVVSLLKQAKELIPKISVEVVRSRQFIFSSYKPDREFLTNELVKKPHLGALDSFQVSLRFENNDSDGPINLEAVAVSSSHTQEMHNIFRKLGKEAELKKLCSVYSAVYSPEKPDSKQRSDFLNELKEYHSSFAALERLGYDPR